MRKVRIPMASLDETHNPKRVEDDRSIAIEAAIVRIMKARKEVRRERERERERDNDVLKIMCCVMCKLYTVY